MGRGVARADGSGGAVVVSRRDYLQDADFLVALATPETALLHRLDRALAAPAYPLCLGRRGFMATLPLCLGTVDTELVEVLEQWPWQARPGESPPAEGLRLVLELAAGATPGPEELCETRWDVPVCFSHDEREYRQRRVLTRWIPVPVPPTRPTPDTARRRGW
ncbi:MAG: type I-E CRISPR-associated protein Cas5/CasD [Armatimonadota bacterium]